MYLHCSILLPGLGRVFKIASTHLTLIGVVIALLLYSVFFANTTRAAKFTRTHFTLELAVGACDNL